MTADPPPADAQPLAYARPGIEPPRTKLRGCVVAVVTVIALCVLAVMVTLPSLGRAREPANRIKCAANLKSLAQHCLLYAGTNSGRLPDSVGHLMFHTDLTGELFVCPSSNATRVEASPPGELSPEAAAAALDAATPGAPDGCLSYVYVGKGMTSAAGPTVVVLYEPPSNHNGAGGNVAYADGHVEWHTAQSLARVIAAVQQGRNPPP